MVYRKHRFDDLPIILDYGVIEPDKLLPYDDYYKAVDKLIELERSKKRLYQLVETKDRKYTIEYLDVLDFDNRVIHFGDLLFDGYGREFRVIGFGHSQGAGNELYPAVYLETEENRTIALLASEVTKHLSLKPKKEREKRTNKKLVPIRVRIDY